MTPSRLDEIEQRLAKATPGPWDWYDCESDLAYLLHRLKAAEAVCEAAEKWSDYKPDNTILTYEQDLEYKSKLHDVLTAWREATR